MPSRVRLSLFLSVVGALASSRRFPPMPCSPTRCCRTRRSRRAPGPSRQACAASSARTSRSTIPTRRLAKDLQAARARAAEGRRQRPGDRRFHRRPLWRVRAAEAAASSHTRCCCGSPRRRFSLAALARHLRSLTGGGKRSPRSTRAAQRQRRTSGSSACSTELIKASGLVDKQRTPLPSGRIFSQKPYRNLMPPKRLRNRRTPICVFPEASLLR